MMQRWTSVLCSGFLWLPLAGCTGATGGNNGTSVPGDAQVTISTTLMESADVRFDAARGQLDVTPPAAGYFTVSFVNNDPALTVQLRVNSNGIREGDQISFPLNAFTDSDIRMTVVFGGRTYATDRPAPQGTVYFQQLQVADNTVDVRASFDLRLGSDTMDTATLTGFVEGHQGSASFD